MKNNSTIKKTYLVGNVTVLPASNELIIDGSVTQIEDKVMQVLFYLIRKHHRIVSREELFEVIWSEVIVSDDSLNRCISIIRKLLQEQEHGKVIRTVRNKGYQLICPATPISSPKPGINKSLTVKNSSKKLKYFVSGILTTVLMILLIIASYCVI